MRPTLYLAFLVLAAQGIASAQTSDGLRKDLADLTNTIGVTGYEDGVMAQVRQKLAGLDPQSDPMGNVTVTFGSGEPRRLLAASVDEPGYVVSKIDQDGYLRVQRLPQSGLPPHYNELQNAQPMLVESRNGRWLHAVSAALSIHLEPGRTSPPDPDDLDNFFIDMGAQNATEVHRSGVDVLSPLAADRHLLAVGQCEWSGTAVGDRFGAAVLLQLAHALENKPVRGTVTLAFVVQQWAGSRGLTRIVQRLNPDEVIYVGRARPVPHSSASVSESVSPHSQTLGSGVWIYDDEPSRDNSFEDEFRGDSKLHHAPAAPFLIHGYGAVVPLPRHSLHIGIPLLWPTTAGETVDERDLAQLTHLLAKHFGVQDPAVTPRLFSAMAYPATPPRPSVEPATEKLLQTLSEAYGVSEQEAMSRHAVEAMLPSWAHPTTDAGGNLVLHLGASGKEPGIVFMAHTDELGFRIRAILPDGSIDLQNKGGGSPAFYWGHPAVIHTAAGMVAGVVELPEGWDTASFHFPADFRAPAKLHVGADSPQAVADLGIKVGDTVTIPKHFTKLLGERVSIRSLDDRVGCTAMVRAVWELGSNFKRNVTFVWSTREELGLEGAADYVMAASTAEKTPGTVFAIDTFVSSDSPIESHRFADAILGAGFVVRAVDNSNIAPWKDVMRLQQIAERHKISVQYGVTGGGNDGAVFQRYGAIDVPLSWPLRYSHSPAELIDLRDLESLTSVTAALARDW
jgi:putative aminopeptidase FrvX